MKIDFTLIFALLLILLTLSIGAISAAEINYSGLDEISNENSNSMQNIVLADTGLENSDSASNILNESVVDNSSTNDDNQTNTSESNGFENISDNGVDDNNEDSDLNTSDELDSSESNESSDLNSTTDINSSYSNNNETNGSMSLLSEQLESVQHNTKITINNTSIEKGDSLIVYLLDENGDPISNGELILKFNNTNIINTSDSNGRVAFKIDSSPGKYKIYLNFAGDESYEAKAHNFTLTITKAKSIITVKSTEIVRGTYLYAYLKDKNGIALSDKKISIKFAQTTFTKTTNANGRVSLKINSNVGSYSTKISFAGDNDYNASSLSFTAKSYTIKTLFTVASTSVVRGKYFYAYLKDSDGNPLSSRKVTIKFNTASYTKTTNAKGRVALKINKLLGKYPVKLSYAGATSYAAASKSLTVTSYMDKTVLSVENTSVVRGKYFYAYLKDKSSNPLSGEKVVISFGSSKYTKTSNANGRVALKINAKPGSYSVKLNFAKTNSYNASSKSLTLKVLTNATAKITANNGTYLGEYSVRLTDMNGEPLVNQTVTIKTVTTNHSSGSKIAISKKTIVLNSDNIYNKTADLKFLNDIASVLKAKGYKVIVNSNIGPNAHNNDIMGNYTNSCIFCIFGGVDSGMFVDMASKWYQYYLNKYDNQVVLGFTHTQRNLATDVWLERAHDDDYSAANFTGLAYPGTYLNDHGMDYVYGRNATEMANNFINYAVKGLSIGLNNTIPSNVHSYSLTTNEAGYVTISDISSGNYNVTCTYSNSTAGYIADTSKSYITIL